MYLHVQYVNFFEYQVFISIKQWIIKDAPKVDDGQNEISIGISSITSDKNTSKVMDPNMLSIYATFFLAVT